MLPPNVGMISKRMWINLEASLIGTASEIDIKNALEGGTLAYQFIGDEKWNIGLDEDVVTDYPIGIGSKVLIKGSAFLNGIWTVTNTFAVTGDGGITIKAPGIKHIGQSWVENGSATLTPFSDLPIHQTKAGTRVLNYNTGLSGYNSPELIEILYSTTEYFLFYDSDGDYDYTHFAITNYATDAIAVSAKKSIDCVNWVDFDNPVSAVSVTSGNTLLFSADNEAKGLFVRLYVNVGVSATASYSVKAKGIQ
jgi:hypothetical protein